MYINVLTGLLIGLLTLAAAPHNGTPCEKLTQMTIPGVQIRNAEVTHSGPGASFELPEFCRISAVARPVPDSEIEFEVWIPSGSSWNGKFQGTGNGGYSGALGYPAMAQALRSGYATGGHNTGHNGESMTFGQGHPEKVRDFAYRALHVMTENAKLLIRVHTGRFAERAYFAGCSTGGHQAISEAQRYPEDYDGIVAGAPANNRIGQTFAFQWGWRALHEDDGKPVLAAAKLALVTKAVVQACDAGDGLEDGLIDDPRRCDLTKVNLTPLLSAKEAEAVRKVWAGPKGIYAGFSPGSEDSGGGQSWARYLLDPKEPMRSDFFRFFLFHDPNWDWRGLDYKRDLKFAEEQLGFMNAVSPDLSGFQKRGGKLLMYAGWADPVVPPMDNLAYYESVVKKMGPAAAGQFLRFFLAPGMGHCGGGPGPNQFDAVAALDTWVTKGVAPEKIIAAHRTGRGPEAKVDRTRPLCPYPQVARYKGSGSIDDAANFQCAAPGR